MVKSKGWDWQAADDTIWLDPAEESYYYCEKWKKQGRKSVLDLGCGLGRHSILFAKNGFKVTSADISEYAVKAVEKSAEKEGLNIHTVVCDMLNMPFRENSFDCIFSYLAISHTDTEGFTKILNKLKQILKPKGEIFLTLCSKETWSFKEANYPKIDENTVVKTDEGPEKDVPHFFVDLNDVKNLFEPDFKLLRVRHINNCIYDGVIQNNSHYHIWASLEKEEKPLDYSDILGKIVKGKIDRPIGSLHPEHQKWVYTVNYGYIEGLLGGDGEEQDVYYLGEDKPVSEFCGRVIAVIHRYNDNEDKWVIAKDGCSFSREEIQKAVDFREKYYDSEIIMQK